MRKSDPDSSLPQWFEVLKAAGNLDPEGITPFTTEMLSKRANIQPTTKKATNETTGEEEDTGEVISTANQIASAWLHKLKRWGYVVRALDQVKGSGSRLMNTWNTTEKGRACELRESLQSRFDRLLKAVLDYREARGKKGEVAAWKALCETEDEVAS